MPVRLISWDRVVAGRELGKERRGSWVRRRRRIEAGEGRGRWGEGRWEAVGERGSTWVRGRRKERRRRDTRGGERWRERRNGETKGVSADRISEGGGLPV